MSNVEEAAVALQRALLTCIGPGAAEAIALAQARLAWQETISAAGLDRLGMSSRLLRVRNGTAEVDASESILGQELTLRAEGLLASANARMRDRPGAHLVLHRLVVSTRRGPSP